MFWSTREPADFARSGQGHIGAVINAAGRHMRGWSMISEASPASMRLNGSADSKLSASSTQRVVQDCSLKTAGLFNSHGSSLR